MAIEIVIVDLSIKNGDFPEFFVSSPEGIIHFSLMGWATWEVQRIDVGPLARLRWSMPGQKKGPSMFLDVYVHIEKWFIIYPLVN